MRNERTKLTSDDHLTGLYALDEVLDTYTNVPAQDIGHSRAYVTERVLQRYPLEQTDRTLFEEPSARYRERPDLTSSDYDVAITVFDQAAKRQDPAESILVRAALETRRDELVGIEQEQTHLVQAQEQEIASGEDNRLENFVIARKTLSALGWNGAIVLLTTPLNSWVEGVIGAATGAAFVVRHEVKKEIRELKARQREREHAA